MAQVMVEIIGVKLNKNPVKVNETFIISVDVLELKRDPNNYAGEIYGGEKIGRI